MQPQPSQPSATSSVGGPGGLVDPLHSLEDPQSSDFIERDLSPLLHARSSRPDSYSVRRLESGKDVTVYVSCSPRSAFTVRLLDNFFSGVCSPQFDSFAAFPVPPGMDESTLRLEIASGVEHYVVALQE